LGDRKGIQGAPPTGKAPPPPPHPGFKPGGEKIGGGKGGPPKM